jgi:WhiB family transcriptional regulator, redox-sensing transcriptional regulator
MNSFAMLPLLPKLSEAACKDYAFPNLFFPEGKKEEAKSLPFVKAICNGCIERKECLDFALEQHIGHGIWAGTTPEMRKSMTVGQHGGQFETTVADRIRELTNKGKSPQQIARLLSVETSYVKLALTRTTRNKGEIQSQTTTRNLSDGSSSSSGSA